MRFGWSSTRRASACGGSRDSIHERDDKRVGSGGRMGLRVGWPDWLLVLNGVAGGNTGNRPTWHVLWRLASPRLWKMMGRWGRIHLLISSGGRVNISSVGVSKRSLSEASTSGLYLYMVSRPRPSCARRLMC
jgi:hypothetical protein